MIRYTLMYTESVCGCGGTIYSCIFTHIKTHTPSALTSPIYTCIYTYTKIHSHSTCAGESDILMHIHIHINTLTLRLRW